MIKVTTLDEALPAPKPEYPCLRQSDNTSLVILFSKENVGTVIVANNVHPIGHYSKKWATVCFMPYNKAVTLENDT